MTPAASGSEPEPSESLKAFGAALKTFRQRAGLTQEQLAPIVRYSTSFISSVEQGRRFPPSDLVERAEEALDAHGVLRAIAKHLSRRRGLASWFYAWVRLEQTAISLDTYDCRLVPGLLQTAPYARAVMLNVPPPPTEEEVEHRLAARMERQQLLTRNASTAFSFVIEEAVLLRGTGGDDVTRELLDHLIEVSRLWNVELQIMPLRQPENAGLDGPICLAEGPDHTWYAYSEGQKTGQLISAPKDVSVIRMRYAKMRSQALSAKDSLDLLKRLRGAL